MNFPVWQRKSVANRKLATFPSIRIVSVLGVSCFKFSLKHSSMLHGEVLQSYFKHLVLKNTWHFLLP